MFRLAAAATLAAFLLLAPPGADAASKVQMYSEAANLVIKTKLADGKVLIDGKDLTAIFTQVDGLKTTIATLKAGTTTQTSTTKTTTTTTETTADAACMVLNDTSIKCAARLWCDAEFEELEDYEGYEEGVIAVDQSEVIESLCSGTGIVYDSACKANAWDTTRVKTMRGLFEDHIHCNLAINGWQTSAVTDVTLMFRNAKKFNENINSWQMDSILTAELMFFGAKEFNQNINSWQMGSATSTRSMFNSAAKFNQPLGSWQTSAVMNFQETFRDAAAFDQNINSWQVGSATALYAMFIRAASFNSPLDSWQTSKVTVFVDVFKDAKAFDQVLNSWDTSSQQNKGEQMFEGAGCSSLAACGNPP